MKKLIACLLCICTLLTLAACKTEPAETPMQTAPTETKKDYSQFAGIVHDPATWYAEFEALPIANDQMTEEELRQLCVDAFKANMTFQWTPNAPISYNYLLSGKNTEVMLPTGIAYSGLAYATGQSSGMVYKILNYYDKETGVLDVEAMDPNKVMSIVTSACIRGAQQAWNRVSNSHNMTDMGTVNQYDSNIIPVGPYTYGVMDYNYDFSSKTATSEIIAVNGEETMYESLALMKKADGLYSSPSWHVMMCSQDPVVVRNAAGKIDPEQSYLYVHEQDAVGTLTDKRDIEQDNGIVLRQLGGIDNQYTFKNLVRMGYIPFTLKEFTGEDPVEPGEAWLGTATSRVEEGTELPIGELSGKTLYGNYAICVLDMQVKNPNGDVLLSWDPEFVTLPTTYNVSLQGTLDKDLLQPYADGKNTIHIYVRIANGELLEAYSGILKME